MLRPCPACRRHVLIDATGCPFCRSVLAPAPQREPRFAVGRLGRAAIFAGAIASAPIGCGDPAPRYETIPPSERGALTGGVVKGRAHRADGAVAAGASVTLYGEVFRQHPASNGLDALTSQVDAAGTFVFRDIPAGTYRFALSGRGRQETITVRVGEAVVLDVTQDKPERLHHSAKPYGAPPARRRIV